MRSQILLVLSSILLPMANAQTIVPDGLLVPSTSVLPACASNCGKLFDVQGACIPTLAEVPKTCFCNDPRLKPFLTGTAGVSSVCGATSCQDAASLQKIQSWYESLCGITTANPTTTSGTPGTTSTGTSISTTPRPTVYPTWFESHWKWVVALIVMVIVIVGGWVGAVFLRRRYLRKKEREFEMRPPVAWGPHQMQGATGGHGAIDPNMGGHSKESVVMPPAAKSKGWLRKERS